VGSVGERIKTWVAENIVSREDLDQFEYLMDNSQNDVETQLENFVLHRRGHELSIRGPKSAMKIGGSDWIEGLRAQLVAIRTEKMAQ
jgi:hypothetical protein